MTKDYTITRKHWRGVEIEIRWNPDWMGSGSQNRTGHLEVQSISPERAPLPITETGYRSHFTPVSAVDAYATPEDYVEAWLDDASRSREWQAFEQRIGQLSLF